MTMNIIKIKTNWFSNLFYNNIPSYLLFLLLVCQWFMEIQWAFEINCHFFGPQLLSCSLTKRLSNGFDGQPYVVYSNYTGRHWASSYTTIHDSRWRIIFSEVPQIVHNWRIPILHVNLYCWLISSTSFSLSMDKAVGKSLIFTYYVDTPHKLELYSSEDVELCGGPRDQLSRVLFFSTTIFCSRGISIFGVYKNKYCCKPRPYTPRRKVSNSASTIFQQCEYTMRLRIVRFLLHIS